MRDIIERLKHEAIEHNYQIGFDRADDRKDQIIEFLKKRRLAVKVYAPGNDLFAHSFSIDKPHEEFVIYVRFDRNFFTATAYKKVGQGSRGVDDEDLINKHLDSIFSYLETLGLDRVIAKKLIEVELGEGPLAAGLTANSLFSVFIED